VKFLELSHKIQWRFKIGVLLVPNQDGTLPENIVELPRNLSILVDNGAYRIGQPLPTTVLVKTLERLLKLDFEDVKLILPDVVEDPYRTVYLIEQAIDKIPERYYQHLIPVLQGRNLQEYLLCFETLKNTLIRSRARSIFNLSRIVAIGGLKAKKPKQRVEIVSKLAQVVKEYRPGNKRLKVHVLGCDLYLLRSCYRLVNSVDTANWTYNATTGHGISIITPDRKLTKLNLYIPDVSNSKGWVNLLTHELFMYLYLINLIVSERLTGPVQELYVSNVSSIIQEYIRSQVLQYLKDAKSLNRH
jgi:hypothetical protein